MNCKHWLQQVLDEGEESSLWEKEKISIF